MKRAMALASRRRPWDREAPPASVGVVCANEPPFVQASPGRLEAGAHQPAQPRNGSMHPHHHEPGPATHARTDGDAGGAAQSTAARELVSLADIGSPPRSAPVRMAPRPERRAAAASDPAGRHAAHSVAGAACVGVDVTRRLQWGGAGSEACA